MQTKDKNKKTICPENKEIETPVTLPAKVVAEVANCSTSLVKQVNQGVKSADTPAGKRIKEVEILWNEGSSLLLQEIKKIVKF